LSALLVKYQDLTPDAFITKLCLNGSQQQCNAIARSFDIEDGLQLKDVALQIQEAVLREEIESNNPDIENPIRLEDVINGFMAFLQENISIVCASFGVAFNGNMIDVCDVLLNRFGGFNMLDWTLFFYRLKEGKYKTEFQSVNTRGVNLEFLIDWCEKYANEKEIAVQEAHKKTKQETVINVTLPQEMAQQIREKDAKIQALKDMRHNWETSDFTEFESIDTKGEPIILEYRHPNIKEVAKVVCSFMWLTAQGLKERITAEYETTKKDFEFWDFYKSKVASLWYQIKNAKTNVFYQLYAAKIDPEKDFTFELEKHFETFVDSEYVGYGAAMIEKQAATEQKLFVMNRKEFALWCVLELYRKRNFENPLI